MNLFNKMNKFLSDFYIVHCRKSEQLDISFFKTLLCALYLYVAFLGGYVI
jgi:hypothetical protein